jgi:hypothetical protein
MNFKQFSCAYVEASDDFFVGVLEELLGNHDAGIVEQDAHIAHLYIK